jgi:redox-sensitive bicupin YhaK (pirin superfamily)
MTNKKVLGIHPLGFQWGMENPFLFCAHHQDAYPKGNAELGPAISLAGRNIGSDFSGKDGFSMYHGDRVPGFPVHPHRGFETITIVLKGLVDHFDSKGAEGRYGNGDVQWMTAGSGCQHVEMFPLVHQDKENPLELFQVWLNLPAKDKFTEPDYKMFWSEDIPVMEITDSGNKTSQVRLIAGTFEGMDSLAPCASSWANDKNNHIGIFLISMEPEATITLPAVSDTLTRNVYFYRGEDMIQIEDQHIAASNRVKLRGDSTITITNGKGVGFLAVLEGEPIQEPVVQYGPFVMNTESEIKQAFQDYQNTRFGGWPWKRNDPVHDRDRGRFARYPDGHMEQRG